MKKYFIDQKNISIPTLKSRVDIDFMKKAGWVLHCFVYFAGWLGIFYTIQDLTYIVFRDFSMLIKEADYRQMFIFTSLSVSVFISSFRVLYINTNTLLKIFPICFFILVVFGGLSLPLLVIGRSNALSIVFLFIILSSFGAYLVYMLVDSIKYYNTKTS